jgi:hypothetical protein
MAEGKSNRGFAKMAQTDPQRQREIAAMGGRASHGARKSGKRGRAAGE